MNTVPIDDTLTSATEPHPGTVSPSPTAFQPLQMTPTLDRKSIWLSPALPNELWNPIIDLVIAESKQFQLVEDSASAQIRIEPDAEVPLVEWIYALVAPFPTVPDGQSYEMLQRTWKGEEESSTRVYASDSTIAALERVIGPMSGKNVIRSTDDVILEKAWDAQPAFAVVPFEDLEPRWKVIAIDGVSPIHKDFDADVYPLTLSFGLSGEPSAVNDVASALTWPMTNRNPDHLTILVMTGTTALARSTASKMERHGVSYPGLNIGDWLREADLTHVSHEVSFAESCPKPDPFQVDLRFCSSPKNLGLFDELGVDLVELTGNHVLDWGPEAFLYSLDLYRQRGWWTYGGGENLEQALQPVLIEHHGNRLAFLGCNSTGPSDAWATEISPGAASCEIDRLNAEIERLQAEGFLVIFTFQWAEGAALLPVQKAGFRQMVDAGATIVSGSQAHQPMGMEFYKGAFVHYGLGNLFFDQMQSLEMRQEFIDRHVIYEGVHISTELLTAMLEDYAQPRPMTPEERISLLERIFTASGW